ncbi:ankyrin repeat-containing domain protein [Neocallimastix lanati (nom. inval.)]|nr:ankyrin repeat-containing domain protein [Neocallimastix sp. JGI-2020a]
MTEIQSKIIKKYLQLNNFIELKEYITNNKLKIEDFKTDYFDPLIYAIEKKKTELINFFIDNYSTFNYELKNGKTPLFVAIHTDNLHVADMLINRKANINYCTKNFHTILSYLAIKRDYSPIHTTYVIEHGFKRNYLELCQGKTFFQYFKGNCSPEQIIIIMRDHTKYYYGFIVEFIIHVKNKEKISTEYIQKLLSFHKQKLYMVNSLFKNAIKSKKLNIIKSLEKYSDIIKEECSDISFRNIVFPYRKDCYEYCIGKIFGVDYQDKLGKTALMYASKYGLIDVVKNLVEVKKANLHIKDNQGYTALYHAVSSGRFGIVKYLIQQNANINECNSDGDSLLICAVKLGYFSLVKLLIQNKININHQNKDGNTALHVAIAKQTYMNSIRHLIINQADVNIKNNNGETSLALAIKNNFMEAINLLLEYKADINSVDNFNNSILTLAIKNDLSYMLIESILSLGANINVKDEDNNTPLRIAIHNGNINTLVRLINHGVDINEENDQNESILDYAFREDHIDIAKYLIRKGAIINKKYYQELKDINLMIIINDDINDEKNHYSINRKIRGYTTLMICCQNNFINIVKYLLDQNVYINEKNQFHETALHHAISGGHYDIIKLLIDHGADIHIKDNDNLTTLMYASREDKKDIVQLLLDHNAEINEKDNEDWTALMFATRNGHNEVVKLLLQYGAEMNVVNKEQQTLLTLAAKSGSSEVVDTLIQYGVNINEIGNNEVSPLKAAISENDLNMIKCLVSHGINISSEAAIDATRYKRIEILDYFLGLGVSVNSSNVSGTLLMQATRTGNTSMIKLLIEKGADINKEVKYLTALRISGIYEYDDIAKILIENGATIDKDSFEDIIAYRLAGYDIEDEDKEMYPDYLFKDNNMSNDFDYNY